MDFEDFNQSLLKHLQRLRRGKYNPACKEEQKINIQLTNIEKLIRIMLTKAKEPSEIKLNENNIINLQQALDLLEDISREKQALERKNNASHGKETI
jgi:hypothetical protein